MSGGGIKNAVLIAGPTASGKSGLATEFASRIGGVVINADSMQVYSVLSMLTARPRPEAMRGIPHLLYGHVDPAEPYSTGAWLRDVRRLHEQGAFEKRRPVFVGGTGLYFKALIEGLSDMPPIPDEVRARWRNRLREVGPAALHETLRRQDGKAARSIRSSDGQRIVRALEVMEASGKKLSELHAQRAEPLVEAASATGIVLEPERAELHRRIDGRFDAMLVEGAVEEVRRLLVMHLDPALPAMKAIGVPELAAYLRGEISLDEAATRAKAATRQYAKRQSTWYRRQLPDNWNRLTAAEHALRL